MEEAMQSKSTLTKVLSFEEVVDLFANPEKTQDLGDNFEVASNLYARICPYPKGVQLTHLDNPRVRQHFLMGSDSLKAMLMFTDHLYMCYHIGFEEKWMRSVYKRYDFDLVIFEANEELKPILADWDGVLELLKEFYPKGFHEAVKSTMDVLKKTEVEEFEKQIGCHFLSIGRNHERFMPFEKFAKLVKKGGKIEPIDARLFLKFNLMLTRLYKGDGYTFNEKTGKRGGKEYFIPRTPVKDLPKKHKWIKLKIVMDE